MGRRVAKRGEAEGKGRVEGIYGASFSLSRNNKRIACHLEFDIALLVGCRRWWHRWDVPRMCFFFFLFLFLFARRVSLGYFGIAVESGFFWDCRACWEGEIRESGVCGLFYFETTFPENVKFFRLFLISIHSSCWVNFEDFQF